MKQDKRAEKIIKEGKVFSKGKIKLFYLPAEHERSKVFFSLSKKNYNAVERNYIKRVVREIIRKNPVPYDLLLKVTQEKIDFNDFLAFFSCFKEKIQNEVLIDNNN
ncbi:MAG: ribonuclease P protein component [Proteobacteria bacterium]|nr:ribonuclease P protein component [Pseudomonadota bacterium]